ncbi:MAG: ABC transporter substrate binding protein [Xanthobacteraceae bacterium]
MVGRRFVLLETDLVEAFREGLRELGYVENQNVIIDYRWAEANYERFPGLIAELITLKPDVIVTAGTPSALAVNGRAPRRIRATKSAMRVPIAP